MKFRFGIYCNSDIFVCDKMAKNNKKVGPKLYKSIESITIEQLVHALKTLELLGSNISLGKQTVKKIAQQIHSSWRPERHDKYRHHFKKLLATYQINQGKK